MIAMISLLGTLGVFSLVILFYILAKLSERFGSVIRMKPLYRYYYVALVFLIIGCITQLLVALAVSAPQNISIWFVDPWFLFAAYHLPLTIAVSIGLVVTWRYWSWLVTEQNG